MSKIYKKLAIIIAAYKAEKYIIETIESLKNQKIPENWEVKFFIGVDDCKNTAQVLKENKLPFFLSEKNVGTYVMANSLINEAKKINCDMFLRFDADDIAKENFIFNGINNCIKKNGFYRTFSIRVDTNLKVLDKKYLIAWGQVFFTKEILNKVGGYKDFRVDCDFDLIKRLKKINENGLFNKNKAIFMKRVIPESLSESKETGYLSNYRRKIKRKMRRERDKNGTNILLKNPIKIELKYVN